MVELEVNWGGGWEGDVGFAGYRAKWKHVTQEPLKCNPAQQKKETRIIIKPSWGEAKNHKYYSCTLPPPPAHVHRDTHNSLPLLKSDRRWEDWSQGMFVHRPRMTRWCLGTSWSGFVCFHEQRRVYFLLLYMSDVCLSAGHRAESWEVAVVRSIGVSLFILFYYFALKIELLQWPANFKCNAKCKTIYLILFFRK